MTESTNDDELSPNDIGIHDANVISTDDHGDATNQWRLHLPHAGAPKLLRLRLPFSDSHALRSTTSTAAPGRSSITVHEPKAMC